MQLHLARKKIMKSNFNEFYRIQTEFQLHERGIRLQQFVEFNWPINGVKTCSERSPPMKWIQINQTRPTIVYLDNKQTNITLKNIVAVVLINPLLKNIYLTNKNPIRSQHHRLAADFRNSFTPSLACVFYIRICWQIRSLWTAKSVSLKNS